MITDIKNIDKQLDNEIRTFFTVLEKKNKKSFVNQKGLTFEKFLQNKFLIVLALRTGISYSLFNLIMEKAPFSQKDWTDYLHISYRTFSRYKANKNDFKSIYAEKIIEIAEVVNIGLEVFDNKAHFKKWLDTPSIALGGIRPYELLRDSYGKQLVLAELYRMDHGIFA